jgi:hypothetical protein
MLTLQPLFFLAGPTRSVCTIFEVFVEQPQGFEVQVKEHQVYKLKKALYGLKKAPRTWYSRIYRYGE